MATRSPAEPRTGQAPPGDRRKKRCKSGRVRQPDQGRFFYSPGVTEPAIGPHDASPHAGQVVRRGLLRRNIVIDARPRGSSPPPSRPRSRRVRLPGRRAGPGVFPRPIASRCSDNGSCPDRKARQPGSLLHIGQYGAGPAPEISAKGFTPTEVVYGVIGTDVIGLRECSVSP